MSHIEQVSMFSQTHPVCNLVYTVVILYTYLSKFGMHVFWLVARGLYLSNYC